MTRSPNPSGPPSAGTRDWTSVTVDNIVADDRCEMRPSSRTTRMFVTAYSAVRHTMTL